MTDYSGFYELLKLLGREGETIRIARGKGADFAHAPVMYDRIPEALDILNTNGYNAWYEINPSNFNRSTGRSNSDDISRLTTLYADLDFKTKPHGLSSLPECLEVVDALSSIIGYQPSAIVYTGGGIHPYWPILDGEVNDINRADSIRRLKRWGALVKLTAQSYGGDADSIYDLPRILRIPGSFNWKESEPRGTSIELTPGVGKIDIAWIDQTLDEYQITVDMVDEERGIVSPMAGWDWAEHNCQFHDTAAREIAESLPTSRHHWALKWSAILHGMIRSGCVTEAGFYHLRDEVFIARFEELLKIQGTPRPSGPQEIREVLKFGALKAQSWSKQKLAEELRGHQHFDVLDALTDIPPLPTVPALPSLPAPSSPQVSLPGAGGIVSSIFTGATLTAVPTPGVVGNLALSVEAKTQERLSNAAFTDTGNAEQLALAFRNKMIWVPGLGWHRWDGSRWAPDMSGQVNEAAKDTFLRLLQMAPDDAARKWAHGSLSKSKLTAAIELSKSIPTVVVELQQMDAKPYELSTPGGIVDLRTAEIRQSNPAKDFHTLHTAATPARMATPKFDAFMRFAIVDDARIAYMQRLAGAAAIGKLLHHIFPILLGSGANGKTTWLDLMAGALGQYATVMPQKFLVEQRGSEHPTEIAQLRGVRMAISSEVPPSARFNEVLVKSLTGETRLKARFIGKDYIEFDNMATQFLAANHLPAVVAGGPSFFRRVRKIDFENQVVIADQNPNLVREILAEEGPGVLQWVIDGAKELLDGGLRDPEKVIISTREYQLEEDMIARFIDENLTDMPAREVLREAVYDRYREWTFKQGGRPLSAVKFAREITQLRPHAGLGSKLMFTNMEMTKTFWQELTDDPQD